MKAAVLDAFGAPLQWREVDDPVCRGGDVIVDIAAAPVLAYTREVFGADRSYGIRPPLIPGCGAIGRVRACSGDATRLKPGDWVFCDPSVRSRDGGSMPDMMLQGWDSRGTGGARLMAEYAQGPFAERMRLPTENAIPIGPIDAADAARWCALMTLAIPAGGLFTAQFQPGESLLVSGATGYFGSATIAAALAMGASKVIAPGRNLGMLKQLEQRFGPRVRTLHLSGDEQRDAAAIRDTAAGPIDCVLDFLPPSASSRAARTAIMSVRQDGRAVLMGGIGLAHDDDLALPYPWLMLNNIRLHGQWMYNRETVVRVAAWMQAGLIDPALFALHRFPLAEINQAIAHAADHAGAFQLTVVTPP